MTDSSLSITASTIDAVINAIQSCKLDNLKEVLSNNYLGHGSNNIISGGKVMSLSFQVHSASRCSVAQFTEIMTYLFENYDMQFDDNQLIIIGNRADHKPLNIIIDILEAKSLLPNESYNSVQRAVLGGNYLLASYLLNIGRKVGEVSFDSLKDHFFSNSKFIHLGSHFEWMLERGADINNDFLQKAICYKEFYNTEPTAPLRFIATTLKTLVSFNLTNYNQRLDIASNCKIIKILVDGNYYSKEKIYYPNLDDGLTINNLKYVLSQNIPMHSISAARLLINSNASKESVEDIISQLKPINGDLSHYNDYIISLINNTPETCVNNKVITDFFGITNVSGIDWSPCEQVN